MWCVVLRSKLTVIFNSPANGYFRENNYVSSQVYSLKWFLYHTVCVCLCDLSMWCNYKIDPQNALLSLATHLFLIRCATGKDLFATSIYRLHVYSIMVNMVPPNIASMRMANSYINLTNVLYVQRYNRNIYIECESTVRQENQVADCEPYAILRGMRSTIFYT